MEPSTLRVLDLFAGLRGWSEPFAERGHSTLTVEYDRSFPGIDLYRNILNLTARARLRTLPFAPDIALPGARRETVWYCRYGEQRAKPTDLWGVFPPSFVARPGCHNGNPDHLAAPRGSTTGTQGTRSDIAAKIPRALALDVCLAAERDR